MHAELPAARHAAKRARNLPRVGRFMAVFVLLVPLAISLLSWNAARQQGEAHRRETFERLAEGASAVFEARVRAIEQALAASAGLLSATSSISRTQFEIFAETLDLEGANEAFGVIDPLAPERLEPYAAEQARLDPGFRLRTGEAPLLVIRFALGDVSLAGLGLEGDEHLAATRAIASQAAAMSINDGKLLAVQTSANARTLAFARISIDALLAAPVTGPFLKLDARFRPAPETAALYTFRREIILFGEPVTLNWRSTPEFEASISSILPELILAAGYLFTALFGALLMTFARQADMVRKQVRAKSRQLAAGERRYADIVANMMDGMVTMDERGIIESFNPAAERLFGYRAAEAIGKRASFLLPPPLRATLEDEFRKSPEAGGIALIGTRRELEGLRKDGTLFPLEMSISEASHAERRCLSVFVRDITELKQMERLKSEFVSMVSHELRTPLTSIRGALGLIAGTQGSSLPIRVGQLVEIALSNSERLILLLNDILDLDKVASGRMEFTYTVEDLGKQVSQAAIANRAYADRYRVGLKVTRTTPLNVRVDAARLMQVMSNLISNAVKHSAEGSTVELSVERAGAMARLRVIDHGEGIPEEFRARIFSRFAQANSPLTRERGGTGLGLSIAQQIVEEMGGAIDFSSAPGDGTTFWVDLPIAGAATLPDTRPTEIAGPLPRVLYVADDGDFSRVLEAALKGNARLVTTTSLRDAEWLLRGERFACVVADLTKPGGLGERIINDPQPLLDAEETPVLVLAAANGVRPLNQDVDLVLVRSHVTIGEIVHAIHRVIGPEEKKWAS